MPELYVGNVEEFEEGGCKIIGQGDIEIGVFRVGEDFYAYRNLCPHQGGPVCQARILGKVEQNLAEDKTSRGLRFSDDHIHIICPWHGYEFDFQTGVHPGDHRVRLAGYPIERRGNEIYVVV